MPGDIQPIKTIENSATRTPEKKSVSEVVSSLLVDMETKSLNFIESITRKMLQKNILMLQKN